jgi:hypothetical protein
MRRLESVTLVRFSRIQENESLFPTALLSLRAVSFVAEKIL